MRKAHLAVILAAVFAVSIVAPAMAVERISPTKNHLGNVGTSTRIWQYGYFDNLIGDGTNATQYGYKKSVKLITTDTTLTDADCGKVITYALNASLQVGLPAAVAGLWFIIVNGPSTITINPQDADYIRALTNAAGDAIRNTTTGNAILLIATSDSEWAGIPYGTWSDVN